LHDCDSHCGVRLRRRRTIRRSRVLSSRPLSGPTPKDTNLLFSTTGNVSLRTLLFTEARNQLADKVYL
jgi:hypothetical protein